MMKTHKEKRIAGALLIACLITQGGYSQEKREHTEPPGPRSLESLGSGAEWTTPFPGFSWAEHPKAFSEVGELVEYEIQIATDADFETLVDEDRVALNRYLHDAPFPPGQYHWRVRAIPYGEDPTNWSAPQDFTIRAADLVVTVDVSGNPVRGVREAVAKAKAAKGQSVRIVMPAGEYAIDRSLHGYLFDLNGCSDIVVDGTGVTLNFSSRKQGLIRSRDSERIAVTGFDVSYSTGALRVQGRVTALDPANRRVSVQVEPGYPGFDASDKPKDDIFYLLEPGTQGRLKSDTRNFFRTNDPFKNHGGGVWSFTITSDFEKWEVGDRFAYNFRAGSMHLVDFSESREVTAHGLTAGGWGGMQFVSIEGDDFRILNCTTRFDPGKWMTGNADGVHIRGHRLGPWIEGLSITAIGDDAIALYARPASIQTARVEGDPKTAYLRPEYFNLEVGDEVSFFQPTEGRILLETQVTSVKPRNDGYVLVSFADDLPEPVKTSGKLVEQTQIWNRSKSCGNFMVRGGEFINIRRYGTVFRSKRGVVENNTYVGNSARAIVFINGTQWPNGLYASEIIVRNNTIADSSFEPSRAAPIAFIFNGYKRAAASIGPRNILIEGNTIEGCPSPEIALHWVQNAVVRANSVKQRDGNTPARLEVRNSEDIVQKSPKE